MRGVQHILTEEEKYQIIQEYQNGAKMQDLRIKYHCGLAQIRKILKENNVDIRYRYGRDTNEKKYCDEHYLDVLDTPEKFYFLGFFAADGTNMQDSKRISIKIQARDVDLLLRFKEMFHSEYELHYVKRPQPTWSDCYDFYMGGKYLCDRLDELGFPQRKTFKLNYPDYIPDEFVRDFIRGEFDGDGCISLSDNNRCAECSFVGYKPFMRGLQKAIKEQTGVLFREVPYSKNDKLCRMVSYRKDDNIKFLNWLYKNSSIYLQRKYNKYIQFINEQQDVAHPN